MVNTILTDDELIDAIRKTGLRVIGPHKSLSRAVEAAVLAKLAQQEPFAWTTMGEITFKPPKCDHETYRPLYAAPQQADRQRVPEEPDWRHPKIQALIGADARNRICIDLVWRILEDPRREFTASDMEYWDKLHDKVHAVALAAAPEAPAQADDLSINPVTLGRTPWAYGEAPANTRDSGELDASAVDERDRKDAERYRWLREQMLGVDFDWDESGKTALCFEMPDGCSFAADCDQVIDDASAALAQKGGAA